MSAYCIGQHGGGFSAASSSSWSELSTYLASESVVKPDQEVFGSETLSCAGSQNMSRYPHGILTHNRCSGNFDDWLEFQLCGEWVAPQEGIASGAARPGGENAECAAI